MEDKTFNREAVSQARKLLQDIQMKKMIILLKKRVLTCN